MKTTLQEQDTQFLVTLDGELDTAAALETERVLQPLYKCDGKDVIFDCGKLEYISSSGLRILLGILKAAKASGGKVTLKNVNDDIKNVFQLTGFLPLFEFA